VSEIAQGLAAVLNKQHIEPEVSGVSRVGDIRHCFADVGKARELLSFEAEVGLDEGIRDLAQWLEGQVASDHVDRAREELRSRGLTV
jgi:dTDP-L-rhamnose 4-epimerase